MSSKGERARLCAFCRTRPVSAAHRPFCSAGCQARDLNAWLSDGYVIPGRSDDDEVSGTSPLDNGGEAG